MKTDILILGAGLTGLSAAYHSRGRDFLVVEKSDHVGGICTSEKKNGFIFDQTGHWFHVKTSEVRSLMTRLLGENYVEIEGKWDIPANDKDMAIHRVAVEENNHGKKLGEKILRYGILHAKNLG